MAVYVSSANNGQYAYFPIVGYVNNVHRDRSIVRHRDAPTYISWSFPPPGYIKINTDGSFMQNSGLAGFGGIARDYRGRWMGGFVGRLGVVTTSCITAELWAIHGGLTFAKNYNLKNVIIETDSNDALTILSKGDAVESHPDWDVIKECRRLLSELRICMMHTLRQGNNCADHLAKIGRMQLDEGLVILPHPPHSLHQLLIADMAHVAYPEAPNSPMKATDGSIAEENKKGLQFIEEVTTNVAEIQKRVLAEILSRNANVEYLQRYDLNGHTDRETFKKVIPVITYEDIRSDINRIANGDTSPIFCSQPISEFLTSSGTSGGERKLMPTIQEEFGRRFQLRGLVMPVISQFVPDLEKGKGMYFWSIKSEAKTPGGLLARPVFTSMYKSPHFNNSRISPYANYTSPAETILCLDSYQNMYSQMLCGLYQCKEVLRVGSYFASSFIRAIQFLEKHWSLLCNDIRTGTINNKITDPSVRDAVMKILKPDSELADFIEAECSKDSWQGIIGRLWPNAKYVDVILTGSMSQYIPTLDYYSNGIPLVSNLYGSSECYFGINLNPFCNPREVSYTLIPTMCYFEFSPVQRDNGIINSISKSKSLNEKEQNQLVDLADVKIGQEYELVVTTYSGLYRYRVGDVLRVTGYKNNAPQFYFVCRENVILSIESDKTDEAELQNAVKNAVRNLIPYDATVTEYTSYADIATIPGHYVLFWELSVKGSTQIPPSVFEDCCLTFEESLNSVYRQGRASDKSIGPLEIRIVEIGTFDKLMDYCVSLGASISQYKTPRCVKFAPLVELLNSRVTSRHFCPTTPNWVPGHKRWSNMN